MTNDEARSTFIARCARLIDAPATDLVADVPLLFGGRTYRYTYDASVDDMIMLTEAQWRNRYQAALEHDKRAKAA